MLHWRAYHYKDGCGYQDLKRRKRRKHKNWYGPLVIACAALLLLCVLPCWVFVLALVTVLFAIGIILVLG